MANNAVYPHDARYAREHGEIEAFRYSKQLSCECKTDIELFIANRYDGCTLQIDNIDELIDEWGLERITLIVAYTLQQRNWDARFSGDNMKWAESIYIPASVNAKIETHSAILDGFVTIFRRSRKA